MLDEIDLIDVATLDRGTYPLDGAGIVRLAPGRLPPTKALSRAQMILQRLLVFIMANRIGIGPDGARRQRKRRTRLGRRRPARPPDRLRQAVAEVEIGHELLSAGREESVL